MNVEKQADLAQLNFSEETHRKLTTLKDEKYFPDMQDALRFAIAYAIDENSKLPEIAPGSRKNMYSASSLDSDGLLKKVIDELYPEPIDTSAYKKLTVLADWGVKEIYRRLIEDMEKIEDILPVSQ